MLAPVPKLQDRRQLLLHDERKNRVRALQKNVPVWQGALPDSHSIRLPIDYFRQFFDTEPLDLIDKQSNQYCTQQNPNHALKLDQKELEQFIGTVMYMLSAYLALGSTGPMHAVYSRWLM